MNPGELRHQVALQSSTMTTNSFGEKITTWSTYALAWAAIKPLQGRELANAKQVHEQIDYEIRIRFRESVDSSHRILFGSRIFEVQAVLNVDERNKELKLLCTEIR